MTIVFRLAQAALAKLNDDVTQAILREDFDAISVIEKELVQTRKQRSAATEALRKHLIEHGC